MFILRILLLTALSFLLVGCATSSRRAEPGSANANPLKGVASMPPARVDSADYMPGIPSSAPTASEVTPPIPTVGTQGPQMESFPGAWVPLIRWTRVQGFAPPSRLKNGVQQAYAMQTPSGTFRIRIGSELANWDGMEVRLGNPPQMIDGQPYMHTIDVRKTLWPLLSGTPRPSLQSRPSIVIDPGHGGEDSGTLSVIDSRPEKEFTLDWALRLRDLLKTAGWEVHLTRTEDANIAISNRVAFSEAVRADLFVSLHFNSTGASQTEWGLETYCLTPAGLRSNLTRGYGDDLTQTFPNNAFDGQNLHLAVEVHRALLRINGNPDRGLRRARFLGVLRGQQRPAILVEGGYLSNPEEARRISDPTYRQKLAEAVAKALTSTRSNDPALTAQTGVPLQ